MSNPWFTFGIVREQWRLANVSVPFEFTPNVRLQQLPDWVRQPSNYDPLRKDVVKALDHEQWCIGVDYEADALGTPDPNWKGTGQQDLQTTATLKIHRVVLSMWLAKRVCIGGDIIVDANVNGGEWSTRRMGTHDRMLTMPAHQQAEFEVADLERAKAFYIAIDGLSDECNILTALASTERALSEVTFPLRHILLWLAMEGLFGPEDGREISYRLSTRVGLFLEGRGDSAYELFKTVKDSYGWRSKLVHGLRVKKEASADELQGLLEVLEDTAHRSLIKILLSRELCEVFNTKKREAYLDNLVFR